jgi:hypothetical protein
MTPVKYTIKDGVTHFHYNPSQLIDFVRRGKRDGNVGLILIKRKGKCITYKGFGTIENPRTELISITMMHHELFDGRLPSDDELISLPKTCESNSESYRFIFLD